MSVIFLILRSYIFNSFINSSSFPPLLPYQLDGWITNIFNCIGYQQRLDTYSSSVPPPPPPPSWLATTTTRLLHFSARVCGWVSSCRRMTRRRSTVDCLLGWAWTTHFSTTRIAFLPNLLTSPRASLGPTLSSKSPFMFTCLLYTLNWCGLEG